MMVIEMNLIEASRDGNLNIVKAMINEGRDINATYYDISALMIASYGGHFDIVKLLVEAGCDVNYKDRCLCNSALKLSIKNGHTEIAKYLKQNGAIQ